MNRVELVGYVCKTPVKSSVKQETGKKIKAADFTICINRTKLKSYENMIFDKIQCVAYGSTADYVIENYHAGTRVSAAGRIRTGIYKLNSGIVLNTARVVIDETESIDDIMPVTNKTDDGDDIIQQQDNEVAEGEHISDMNRNDADVSR